MRDKFSNKVVVVTGGTSDEASFVNGVKLFVDGGQVQI
jgi:hypothetical protein